jgi:hypothetical protein
VTLLQDEAARLLNCEIVTLQASQESELEPAFASLASQGAQALIISTDPFFFGVREYLVALGSK